MRIILSSSGISQIKYSIIAEQLIIARTDIARRKLSEVESEEPVSFLLIILTELDHSVVELGISF